MRADLIRRWKNGTKYKWQVRTAVEYIVREGVSAPLPELAQQLVAREMLQILAEVAGSAPPASGFPPLLNEHQIQVGLSSLRFLYSVGYLA